MTEAVLALTYDPSVFGVSSADISLGSIPSLGVGWQLVSVVDQATGQIGIADRNPAIHRNSQRLAIPHEWPRKGGASRGQTKLNAAMVNEFIGISRRSPLCEVSWRANNGHFHRFRYTDGYHTLSGTVLRAYPGVETLCDKVDRRVAHVQLQLGLRVG